MRKVIQIILVVATLATGASFGADFRLDRSHTQIGFRVRHMGISWVSGAFREFEGSIQFDPENLKEGTVEVTIQSASVDTGVGRRDDHLRSADFLEVEKFPTITFKSTEVRNVEGEDFEVVGDLTIHGVTKEVVLDAELGGVLNDRRGSRAAFSASARINRKEFGLSFNRLVEAGGALVVGDEVRIQIDVEAVDRPSR